MCCVVSSGTGDPGPVRCHRATAAEVDGDLHFAFGDTAKGIAGFRLTLQQALAAQAVALAAVAHPSAARSLAVQSVSGGLIPLSELTGVISPLHWVGCSRA